MATESWMVIVNPKAGSGRGLKDWPVISNLMYNSGLKFTCVFTEHKFHAIELTVSAVNNGYRHIVAVGGGDLHPESGSHDRHFPGCDPYGYGE